MPARSHVIIFKFAMAVMILGGAVIAGDGQTEDQKSREREELTPLKVDSAKPVFAGTPHYFKLPENIKLDPEERKRNVGADGRVVGSATCLVPRAEVRVPKGTQLISKGKNVSASDSEPAIGEISCITDGEPDTITYVELGPGLQWVQVDLGEMKEIWAICVWHDFWPRKVYRDVIVQVADDEAFTKNVHTVFNNDHDGSAKKGVGEDYEYIEDVAGKLIEVKGLKGRFVRCFSNGSTAGEQNSWSQLSVFGRGGE